MSVRLTALVAVIAGFGVLSAIALMDAGYLGIIVPQFRSWGGVQVITDLVILGILACIWIVQDSRGSGLSPWPFVAITLVAGSFGPLLYVMARELRYRSRV